MLVKKLMTGSVTCCKPGDTLDVAAEQLWQSDCGALPVCDPADSRKVVGMVTDRDICMHAHFNHRPLDELIVDGAMTHGVKTCRMTDDVHIAEQIMSSAAIRRLPVVDDSGNLVGIVSLADIAGEAAKQRRLDRPEVTETEIAGTLSAICSPRALVATAA
ncbi:MAG: CBS domain-containing protein [Gammaproteobacteria bacterium]|nr:CBS domain-containing protein [Gammaproteobacteria bacterium]